MADFLRALKRVYRFWVRLDVAAALFLVVLLLAALGSCFPQRSAEVAADLDQSVQWEAALRARYGRLTDLFAALGVFHYFGSPIFLLPLLLLALVILTCTLARWRAVWRRAFRRPVCCSDVALDTAPHTAKLSVPQEAPGGGGDLPHVVRESLRQRGFHVRSETVGGVAHLRGDRNRLAPQPTLVTHLAVLLLLLGAALSGGFGWREEVTVGPDETVEVGHGSGLALRSEGFAIVRYPDGSAAGYEADVVVLEAGQEMARGAVEVNEPLSYNGVRVMLRSYRETDGRYSVSLLVVHDPGYGLVITAGFLLLFGLSVSFNFPPATVHARVEPAGTVRLAGRANRRAWGFEREFASLVGELTNYQPADTVR